MADYCAICCQNGEWIELAKGRMYWRGLVLAVLKLQVSLQKLTSSEMVDILLLIFLLL